MSISELRSSYLVQRITKPTWIEKSGKDNPFNFGGGLRNGGLSDEAMGLLRSVFAFDYMGSAEFEFGAVPKALQTIAKHKLVAFSFEIDRADAEKPWNEETATKGSVTIYALCLRDQAEAVEQRIREIAAGTTRHKESPRFSSALRPVLDWDTECCGWLELDNGSMFFTDAEMWRKTCSLFGVDQMV